MTTRPERRGVILLVVLAMLALFSVVTLTYVLVSSQSQRTAVAAARLELHGDSPRQLLDEAFFQVVRGSTSPASVLRPHSLLEDMYGNDGLVGLAVTADVIGRFDPPVDNYGTTNPESPILAFSTTTAALTGADGKPGRAGVDDDGNGTVDDNSELNAPGSDDILLNRTGQVTGCWLTFTSGDLRNQTLQIIDCRLNRSLNRIILLVYAPGGGEPVANDTFLINGRPFNGAGFGAEVEQMPPIGRQVKPDSASAWIWNGAGLMAHYPDITITATLPPNTSWPYALLPNPRAFVGKFATSPFVLHLDPAGHGGADEPYDAKDFQNMLLARVPSPETGGIFIPSLHDPALINYWYKQMEPIIDSMIVGPPLSADERRRLLMNARDSSVSVTDDVRQVVIELKRKFILRPLREDHPKFTGSNVATMIPHPQPVDSATGNLNPYWEISGWADLNGNGAFDANEFNLWDVDNDGDGVADGIWVDLGLPAQAMPDGTRYKPLVSVLCLDLDGRLNLNAHGNAAQLARDPAVAGQFGLANFIGPFAGANPIQPLSFGQGYGPPDVNLRAVLDPNFLAATGVALTLGDLENLLYGATLPSGQIIDGRYGEGYLRATETVGGRTYVYGPGPGRSGLWDMAGLRGDSVDDDDRDGIPNNFFEVAWRDPAAWSTSGYWQFTGRMSYQSYDSSASRHAYRADDNHPIGPVAVGACVVVGQSDVADMHGNLPAGLVPDGMGGFTIAWTPGVFGTPADLDGDGAVGVDFRGQPVFVSMGEMGEAIDDPYELDLTKAARSVASESANFGQGRTSRVDAPFEPGELERILRPFDFDVQLTPSRLAELSNPADPTTLRALADPRIRHLLTTESWDVPNIVGPLHLLPNRLTDDPPLINRLIAYARLLVGGGVGSVENDRRLTRSVSPSLMAGLKIDLNRPLGDGVDNDGDGTAALVGRRTVDDPVEATRTTLAETDRLWRNMMGYGPNGIVFDHNNDGFDVTTGDPVGIAKEGLARQYLARQLYLLVATLRNPNFNVDFDADGDGMVTTKDTLHVLAQWAVNVVDFRDRDSIMTAFEYDTNPASDANDDGDPWDVDGDPATIEPHAERGLVWGCERPELLLTETLAFHDRRTEDRADEDQVSTVDPTPVPAGDKELVVDGDEDYDQRELPVGSLFLELYNPWTTHDADASQGVSAELYAFDALPPGGLGNPLGVDLGKLTPTGGSPVWRLAITLGNSTRKATPPEEPAGRAYSGGGLDDVERVVYFVENAASFSAINDVPGNRAYHMGMGGPQPIVAPGRFAVIGPEAVTELPDGSKIRLTNGADSAVAELDASSMAKSPYNSTDEIQQTITGIVINQPQRLSVSEPTEAENYSSVYNIPTDGMGNPITTDVPIDKFRTDPPGPGPNPHNENQRYDALRFDATNGDGGVEEPFRFVHLQRLANPLLPWDAQTNPYLTIDTMAIDLTVYDTNPESPDSWLNSTGTTNFDSRQRKGPESTTNSALAGRNVGNKLNLWSHDLHPDSGALADRIPKDREPSGGDETSPLPDHSLGYFSRLTGITRMNRATLQAMLELAYTAPEYAAVQSAFVSKHLDDLIGAPQPSATDRLPWLTWNNRPFISEMELLLVPWCRASQLTRLHTSYPSAGTPAYPYSERFGGFEHLLNFFGTSDYRGQPPKHPNPVSGTPQSYALGDLYRIFDYVTVPSRYSGTEDLLDPGRFAAGLTAASAHQPHEFGWAFDSSAAGEFVRMFRPPFNRLPRMREPGRINLNTILTTHLNSGTQDSVVWKAIAGDLTGTATWQEIAASRRGFATATTPLTYGTMTAYLNDEFPSLYANPFRTHSGNVFVPLQELTTDSPPGLAQANQIDVTIFRRNQFASDLAKQTQPLFEVDSTGALPHRDPDANPFFRYQLLNRMRNLVTTRSNVYAIWITVGYFEVEQVQPGPGNPDGLALGAEVGTATGEVKRHRAFYLFDRTRPMAFERGKNHNLENGVLLRRFIE